MSRTFNPPLCEPPGVEVGGGVTPPGWGVLLCAIDPTWAGGTLPWWGVIGAWCGCMGG
jgi:hypothetical protein